MFASIEISYSQVIVPDVPDSNAESQTEINRRLFEEIQTMKDKIRGLGESMDKNARETIDARELNKI